MDIPDLMFENAYQSYKHDPKSDQSLLSIYFRIYTARGDYIQWATIEIEQKCLTKVCHPYEKENRGKYLHTKVEQIRPLRNKSRSGCFSP